MIIEIYTRPGCHLCEEAKKVLLAAARRFPFQLIEKNVQANFQWETEFGKEIPVVFINGKKAFKYRVPAAALEVILTTKTRSHQDTKK